MTSSPDFPFQPDGGLQPDGNLPFPGPTLNLPRATIPEFNPPDTKVNLPDLNLECATAWRLAGWVLGDADASHETITGSAGEFSDLVSADIKSASSYNKKEWQNACLVLTFAASVADLWYKDVAKFREERQELIDRYQSAAFVAGIGKKEYVPENQQGLPGAAGPPIPANPLQAAYDGVYHKFMEDGRKLKKELVETAGDRAKLLDGGPEPANLKVLVEAGVLGWGAYNILGAEEDVPLPVSEAEAKKMAGELEAYLKGDKDPDARYYEILASVTAVATKAKALQKANKANIGPSHPMSAASSTQKLNREELEFLETFYGELEDQAPNGVVRLVPWLEGHDGPDWSDAERKAFTGAMADGLLTLSDEKVGGGQERLPESVQKFANGIPSPNEDVRTGRHINDPSMNWLADARDFGLLMAEADPGLHGGTEFSANTTLSMGHHLANKDLDLHESYDRGLSAVLDVTTRNEEANHRILTDAHDHPLSGDDRPQIRGLPDFETTSDALVGLYAYEWADDGKAVAGLTDWIPEFSRGTSAQAEMAGTATLGLMETLAGDGDDKPFHDTDNRSETEYKLSITEINPQLTDSLTKIYLTYQEDLTLGSESRETNGYATITSGEGSLLLHDRLDKALFVDGDTQKGFIQLLVADNKNAGIITSSVESLERKIIDIGLDSPNNAAARQAGANLGSMRTIVHDAMIDEYVDRTENRQEAKNQAADNWQTGFNITVAISNGALGAIPVAGPVLAPTSETLLRLFEHPGKADFLEEWEHKNQSNEKRPQEIIDYGPKSVQHAQLQLLDVMARRGSVDPDVLTKEGLLPTNFDAKEDLVVQSFRDQMGGRNADGNYSSLMEILRAAGKDEANSENGKNPIPAFFEGVEQYYAPDSKEDKGES